MATVTLKKIGGGDLESALDLTIRDREFVVLTGPGGASSAIVRLIAGLAEVSQGEILFDEGRINELPPKDRDVAFLSHDYMPYPGMSVYQNLALALERRKFGNAEIKKRIASVAETLGLQNDLAGSPESLSAQEQRLVGLARVMVCQPKICLFDEPFANLDRAAASRGRAVIAELRQRSSATILYATSDPTEALALGARTVVMEGGVVQQDADAQAIFDEPANVFVAKFFGEPPMNLVYGTLKQERDAVTFSEMGDGTIAIRLPASRFASASEFAGQMIILGFRPNAVEMAGSPQEGGRPGASFRALVERTESRGSETDLYIRTGAHELICRSHRWGGQEGGGHRFQFEIELEKAHLFDAVSGRRLAPGR
jgi:multiple sugar transport system ATP-binding protein